MKSDTTIYFVRHAKSEYVDGQERSRGLTDEGKQDAQLVKEQLQTRSIDGVVSKTYEDFSFSFPGGETNRNASRRGAEVVRRLLREYRGRTLALASHGNIMTLILNAFNDSYGIEFFRKLSMPDIYRADFQGDRWCSWNGSGKFRRVSK